MSFPVQGISVLICSNYLKTHLHQMPCYSTHTLLSLFFLTILSDLLLTSCPIYQKLSTPQSCLDQNPGTKISFTCSTLSTIKKFTFVAWLKYSPDNANYKSGKKDILFYLKSPTESNPRLVVGYQQGTGYYFTINTNQYNNPNADNFSRLNKYRKYWHMYLISNL